MKRLHYYKELAESVTKAEDCLSLDALPLQAQKKLKLANIITNPLRPIYFGKKFVIRPCLNTGRN